MHAKIFEHVKNPREGFDRVDVGFLFGDVAFETLARQFRLNFRVKGDVREDRVPNRVVEIVLAVDRVEVCHQARDVGSFGNHLALYVGDQQGRFHAAQFRRILLEEQTHAENFFDQRLNGLDEVVLGLFVELEVSVVILDLLADVDLADHG